MSDEQRMVTEFHRAFDVVIGPLPSIPDAATCTLRVKVLIAVAQCNLHFAAADGDIDIAACRSLGY